MDYLYSIDSHIPAPPVPAARGAMPKYPLKKLQPGQSFYVPETDPRKAKNLRSAMATRARKLGIRVVSAADPTGVRVWRLS